MKMSVNVQDIKIGSKIVLDGNDVEVYQVAVCDGYSDEIVVFGKNLDTTGITVKGLKRNTSVPRIVEAE
jgi:hypothetical protein